VSDARPRPSAPSRGAPLPGGVVRGYAAGSVATGAETLVALSFMAFRRYRLDETMVRRRTVEAS
jgi:hypothetical protein